LTIINFKIFTFYINSTPSIENRKKKGRKGKKKYLTSEVLSEYKLLEYLSNHRVLIESAGVMVFMKPEKCSLHWQPICF